MSHVCLKCRRRVIVPRNGTSTDGEPQLQCDQCGLKVTPVYGPKTRIPPNGNVHAWKEFEVYLRGYTPALRMESRSYWENLRRMGRKIRAWKNPGYAAQDPMSNKRYRR